MMFNTPVSIPKKPGRDKRTIPSQVYFNTYNSDFSNNGSNDSRARLYPKKPTIKNRLDYSNVYYSYDQASLDGNPIESTLLNQYVYNNEDPPEITSLSNSTRSFEDNIDEYLDPQFDDLRRPDQIRNSSCQPEDSNN